MAARAAPFHEYAFTVYLKDPVGAETPIGGFSAAAGLPVKLTGVHKAGDVTLKRGVIADSNAVSHWISTARDNASARRDVIVSERGGPGTVLKSWRFVNAHPKKYVGPPLVGAASEIAIETLTLTHEGVELWPSPKSLV
jgi:phage tail-like protein